MNKKEKFFLALALFLTVLGAIVFCIMMFGHK